MRDPVRRHHRPLPVRRRHLVFADVSARPARARPRGLLHRGHRRVRLRPGAEHAGTDPSYGTRYIHAALEPFGLGDAGASSTTTAATTAPSRDAVRRLLRGRRSVHQSVGRLVVLARRVRAHSAQGVHRFRSRRSRSSRSPRPSRGTWSSSAVRSPVHVRREHRHAGVHGADRRLHLAQDLAAGRDLDDWRTDDSAAARSLHDGDDLADRELHRRRRQQGQEFVQFIDLPSRTAQRFELAINGPQTAAARARLVDAVDAMDVSRTPADYREFIQRSRAEFGVAKHTYVATRSGWFSDRTECYLASGRPALVQDTGWTRAPAVRRRAARLLDARGGCRRHRSHQRRLRRTTRAARWRSRASTSTPRRVLSSLLERHRVRALRIAHIAPVATTLPPPKSGSVETMTSLLTEGLVRAATTSRCSRPAIPRRPRRLHAIYPHGYWHDEKMWPWELYEMLNLAAAVERAAEFDIIHYEAAYYPMSLGVHAALADADPADAAPFAEPGGSPAVVALSRSAVRRDLARAGAPAVRPQRRRTRAARHRHRRLHVQRTPDDYLLFLGRFTEGKGVLQAIEIAKAPGCG